MFCDQCGKPAAEGEHARCADRRTLEPPRFCVDCARRMVVQVTPTGWTARCSRHGELASSSRTPRRRTTVREFQEMARELPPIDVEQWRRDREADDAIFGDDRLDH